MTQMISVEKSGNQVYEIQTPDKSIVIAPQCKPENILVKGPSKIEVITIPPSAQGPRGKAMEWSDLTSSQKAEITPTISVGSTTTSEPGGNAYVTDSGSDKNHVFDFVIPRGIQGTRGEQGIPGVSPTVRVGTVTTLPEGSQATVRNSGTTENVVLDFGIPIGNTGSVGPSGVVQDVLVSSDGETWTSAMVGNVAKVLVNGGGGGGGEVNVIEVVQKNGVDLPVVNKTVNVQVPTSVSQLTQDIDYARTSNLSNVAFSGQYSDLQNKPTIPTKTSDLVNDSDFVEESSLSEVATSGDYNDLINKPTIPAAQVNSDWNSSSGVSQILNKPDLSLKEDKSNKVTSISSSSTDTQYPSAKAVYDAIQSGGGGGGHYYKKINSNVINMSKDNPINDLAIWDVTSSSKNITVTFDSSCVGTYVIWCISPFLVLERTSSPSILFRTETTGRRLFLMIRTA